MFEVIFISRVTHVFRQYILNIFSFRKYLLNCYYVPGTVTHIGNVMGMNKIDMSFVFMELRVLGGEIDINKINNR